MKYLTEKEEKFDSIYRSYADDVYKVCLYFSKDYDIAQDLAQQTFINFYNHFDSVEPENIRAYLVRSARNLYYNYQRDAKRKIQTESISEDENRPEFITESLEEEYFRKLRRAKEEELSDKILGDLHQDHISWYEIFDKMYFSNKSREEISDELGITEEVLYSRIYRAKRWVRKRYEKMFKDISDMA